MEFLSHNVTETEDLGRRLAEYLRSGDVVAFFGGLGAGKTAFTRGLAAGLGCRGRVTSPTFTIVNEYELFDIGWEDYLARPGVCAVEWSEQAPGALPPEAVRVTIRPHPDQADWRIITVEGRER